ncbi:MAG TPA: hypothetical protein VK708_20190 [Bryobacteraceae bacterium]|jgi:hypothetical protein|nr:hypothetical protein [Bryobacteraceae bacterium]
MKKKILAGLILAGSTLFAAPRVSFGVGFGVPAPVVVAPPVYAAVPPCPGPGYVFVDGYWRLGVGHRDWRAPEHFEHFDRHAEHFRR